MSAVMPNVAVAAGRALCLAALAFTVSAAAPQGAPPKPAETTVTATAVIRGKVVAAATGAAIIGAEVRVRATGGRDTRLVTTDDQGQFDVRDLPSGQWTVTASKAGFVSQEVGQTSPFDSSTPVTLSNGQRLAVEVRLTRGSAVAGRVVSEFGDPIGGVPVQVVRARTVRGVRQLMASGSGGRTDDLGNFRVYGLVPGEYYVMTDVPSADNTFAGELASVTTYFPGASRLGDAQMIRLRAGEDQLGIDITAPSKASFVTVSGVVVGADGRSPADAEVSLFDSDLTVFPGTRRAITRVDGNGRFVLNKVPPGSYLIEAGAFRSIEGVENGKLPVEVGASDVSGLTIALTFRPRIRVDGTVVTDAGTAPLSSMELTITTSEAEGFHSGVPAPTTTLTPGNTGRFTTQVTAGNKLTVDVSAPGWMVRRFEINGRESVDGSIDAAPGVTTATVRILLSNRVAEVTGTVALGAAARAGVVIFPDNAAKRTYPSRYVKTARTDAEGRFTISGLPAERYRIVALSYLEEFEFQDPVFLEQMQSASTDLRLVDGEKKTIALPLTKR